MMPTSNYDTFIHRARELSGRLLACRQEVLDVLCKYETFTTANDEIERSLETLDGFEEEFSRLASVVHDLRVTTFFPLNLPLYSLILFAVAPSAFSERVYVRAPILMQTILQELLAVIDLPRYYPNILVKQCSRGEFMDVYVKSADVVIFTGKYENGIDIQKQCPQALFIFNGGGVNPAVVYADANINDAANKIYEMRTFNSGQDCAGTDAILVDEKIFPAFFDQLKQNIASAEVGLYGNRTTEIGPVLRDEYIDNLQDFLQAESENIIYCGGIDTSTNIIQPYVIKKSLADHHGEFHEFFAPIFYILTFKDESEVKLLLASKEVKTYSMYVTYFSYEDHLGNLTFAKVLKNKIVNDVERGNEEYGGYGSRANFVSFNDRTIARPILISREIDSFVLKNELL